MRSGEIETSLFAATDAAGLERRGRRAARRHLLQRDRLPPRSAPRRPLRRGLRGLLQRRRVRAHRPHRGRRVHQRRPRPIARCTSRIPRPRRLLHARRQESCARRSCARRSSSRASAPGSPRRASIPCCNTWRAHKGVDYAAPVGTRVKATADGVRGVRRAARAATATLVVLRHNNGHTHRVRPPVRLRQGLHAGARQPGRRDRLRRHDRAGDRSAPALRVPRQRRAPEPAAGWPCRRGRRSRASCGPRSSRRRSRCVEQLDLLRGIESGERSN